MFLVFLFLLFILSSKTQIVSEEALHQNPHVQSRSFESWMDCREVDSRRNVYNRLRCQDGDNLYHELVVEVGVGHLDPNRIGQIQQTEIPLNVAAQFTGFNSLETPESCLPKTEGECLLLNQGDAKLRVTSSPLYWEHKLSPTPVLEFPYDYFTSVLNIEGGLDVITNLTGSDSFITSVEGIPCFLENLSIPIKDQFLTGERCPVLSCPCGAAADIEGSTDPGIIHNLFAEVHGSLPSCGLFPIENEFAKAQMQTKVEFFHFDEGQTREFRHSLNYSTLTPEISSDQVDPSGTIQVIAAILKDPSRYSKTAYNLQGAIVICNWDGKYNWSGPFYENGDTEQIISDNMFPIPLRSGRDPSARDEDVWTWAAWYYIDDYAFFDDYQPKTLQHNGVSMIDVISQVHYYSEGFFDPVNGSDSYCCTEFDTEEKLDSFLRSRVIPRVTPAEILNVYINGTLPQVFGLPRSYAPSYTRFRGNRPGFKPVTNMPGIGLAPTSPIDVVDGFPNRLTKNNVVRPFLGYRLFGDDFLMHQSALMGDDFNPPLTVNNYPRSFTLRRTATQKDIQPFATKIAPRDPNGAIDPEFVLELTALISDRALSGRHLNNKTFIPSTFASVTNETYGLRCNVVPHEELLEITGFICNAGTFTRVQPESFVANLTCYLPKALRRMVPPGTPLNFTHRIPFFLEEAIDPRKCNNFSYVMTPSLNAPYPFNSVSSLIYKGDNLLNEAGLCDLSVFYKAPLHKRSKESLRNLGIGHKEILVGQYENIRCENVQDIDYDDADSDGYFVRQDPIPPEYFRTRNCEDDWDIACFLNRRSDGDEDMGGTLFIIVYGSIVLFFLVIFIGYIIWTIHKETQKNVEKIKNMEMISKTPN